MCACTVRVVNVHLVKGGGVSVDLVCMTKSICALY